MNSKMQISSHIVYLCNKSEELFRFLVPLPSHDITLMMLHQCILYMCISAFFTWLLVWETPPSCMCLCEHFLHDCMWEKPHHPVCVYMNILYMTACERNPTTLYVSMWVFFTWLHVRETPPSCMCLCVTVSPFSRLVTFLHPECC